MSDTKDPFAAVTRENANEAPVHPLGCGAFSRHKGLVNVIAKDPGAGDPIELPREGARD